MYRESTSFAPDSEYSANLTDEIENVKAAEAQKAKALELEKILTPEQKVLYTELREIMDRAIFKQPDVDLKWENQDKLAKFADKKQNPDFNNFILSQLIMGSGDFEHLKLDFDSEDHKIEKFVRSLEL